MTHADFEFFQLGRDKAQTLSGESNVKLRELPENPPDRIAPCGGYAMSLKESNQQTGVNQICHGIGCHCSQNSCDKKDPSCIYPESPCNDGNCYDKKDSRDDADQCYSFIRNVAKNSGKRAE